MSVVRKSVWVSLVCCVLVASGCGKKVSIDSAIVPDADVIISADIAGAADTAMSKTMKKMKDEFEAIALNASPDGAEAGKQLEKALSDLGITEDDIVKVLFSADIPDQMFTDDAEGMKGDDLNILLGVELSKALDVDKSIAVIVDITKDADKDEKPEVSKEAYKGVDLIVAKNPSVTDEDELTAVSVAFLNKGKLLIAGPSKAVKAAVDSKKGSALTDEMTAVKSTVIQGAHAYAAVSIPAAAIKKMKDDKAAEPEQENGGFSMPTPPVEKTVGFSLSTVSSDKLDYKVTIMMEDDKASAEMNTFVNNTVISMLKMFSVQPLKGKSLDVINELKSAADGSSVNVSTFLSEKDLEVISALIKENMPSTADVSSAPEED